ncbi:MAG: hypothetical protein EXQ91_05185 [Alphaproteobacteria bacterium]|nr:hypothetical protein [Alphaproteobacteria bacterium]
MRQRTNTTDIKTEHRSRDVRADGPFAKFRRADFASDNLDGVEARFDAKTPNGRWGAYGTWTEENASRLIVFRLGQNISRLTLIRFSDDTFDLEDSDGRRLVSRAALDTILDHVIHN